ncbi:EamA family transporter [Gilliamella sp. Pra-s65]|uniref:EamA family transporter n=1 Tax=unclassified Gilliamella TaxID=2685620 RepID=UPI00132BE34A|nr:EamA family transporter [Gilliamella sp. Pra-s60]MWN89754.1 EamA family transporter [Gilliamella sp. Pra-s65]MWP29667.1 EamA family transporter [Gilliamella sp. Pra-s54]MWP47279.1 EamA family transporter [Gilliamella sp. Pas-s27]MWP72762.1 EamA family transporter [Gilliamella sp. Pra-s52]
MSTLIIALWLINLTCDTIGQIAFKYAAITSKNKQGLHYWQRLFANIWLWIGFGSYFLGFIFWLAFLSEVSLSAGILLGSFNIITVMLAGRILFKEHLTLFRIVGILFITTGVVLVGLT